MSRYFFSMCTAAWSVFIVAIFTNGLYAQAAGPSGDVVCGPRCVDFVSKYYNRESDLMEIIKEIQWPDVATGTSMDRISQALGRRGIYSKAMYIEPSSPIKWHGPVVVHLKPLNSKSPDQIGHFVVWLPNSTDVNILLHCGLAGVQSGKASDFAAIRSGYILVTSDRPISQSEYLSQLKGRLLWMSVAMLAIGLVVAGCRMRGRGCTSGFHR